MNSQNEHSGKIRSVFFRLNISAEQYKAYYQGQVQFVQVQGHDGRTIRFPASAIRGFLTAEGVTGDFEIQFDENNKLVGLKRRGT